ncbi:uncharacterized protein LDX57_005065 [Aspergillus melleus]|uniref:uncharacterized protein n=1 Tax=Aspergillus melleus TaxID=138277 RepID=UPI001E8E8018|nr:uncharacterized protein LDX57_005065 [Aspergillus melleus]KAH8427352.1 hypothetical protein LDX57_005065 [Aspergillus melleus]
MSRALGDLAYKNLATEHTSIGCPESDSREIPDAPGVQDGLLSSEPFITRMTLAEHGAYILALTSDGVTDQLEDSEILNRLSDSWDADPRAQRAARILVSEVGHRPRSDMPPASRCS